MRTASRLYAPHSDWRVTTGVADDELRASGMAFADRQAIIDWIRAENGNLVRLAHRAARLDGGELVAYAVALHVPVGSQGYWQERREIYEHVLAEKSADVAYVRRDLGSVCNHLGLLDRSRAVLEDAARTFRERDDAYLEADTLVLLAEADGDVEHLRRARALSHRFDDYRLEANALVAMAELLAKEGNYADARTCLDQTLALYRTHGSTTGIGRALGKLGELCQRFGHLEDAAEFLAEAVEACRNVGMSLREAARTWDLADVLNDLGRTDAARQHRDAAIGWVSGWARSRRSRSTPSAPRTDHPGRHRCAPTREHVLVRTVVEEPQTEVGDRVRDLGAATHGPEETGLTQRPGMFARRRRGEADAAGELGRRAAVRDRQHPRPARAEQGGERPVVRAGPQVDGVLRLRRCGVDQHGLLPVLDVPEQHGVRPEEHRRHQEQPAPTQVADRGWPRTPRHGARHLEDRRLPPDPVPAQAGEHVGDAAVEHAPAGPFTLGLEVHRQPRPVRSDRDLVVFRHRADQVVVRAATGVQ